MTTPTAPFLDLPARPPKPREAGLTILLDAGQPTAAFRDVIESHGDLIDLVKFGWGTAVVTREIARKIDVARGNGIETFVGGSLFEKALVQNKLDAFRRFVSDLGCRHVEISNGTIELSNAEKAKHIAEFARDFQVLSEVGFKDAQRSLELHPAGWVRYIEEDIAAGAWKVITEARESGRSGVCRENGELRIGLINEIIESIGTPERLVFEAPTKRLQVEFITRVGPGVNLANIAPHDVVAVETLRLGLRADTLETFEGS